MSDFIKTNKYWLLTCVVIGIGALASFLAVSSGGQSGGAEPVEIVLVSRDVAFWLGEDSEMANPDIELERGRPVKLVLVNDEPEKVLHCFTISGLDVHSTRDLATGESETITFTPTESGIFAYACLMHPTMTGKVIVK